MLVACAVCFGTSEGGSSAGTILPLSLMVGALLYALFFVGGRYGPTILHKFIRR